ncbi:MAG: TetR/AcrR family transcriptional regulator [Hyphomicrobiaceae bacterium]
MAREVAERPDVVPLLAEVFREYGVEGASLSVISKHTGLGKGSLYHFFPGGKDEMVAAVLSDISEWFEKNIFEKLSGPQDPKRSVLSMFDGIDAYFHSGGRVCLVGALAIDNVRDRFAMAIHTYFKRWMETLALALQRLGCTKAEALALSEEIVVAVQGALVLARALDNPTIFRSTITRYKYRVASL